MSDDEYPDVPDKLLKNSDCPNDILQNLTKWGYKHLKDFSPEDFDWEAKFDSEWSQDQKYDRMKAKLLDEFEWKEEFQGYAKDEVIHYEKKSREDLENRMLEKIEGESIGNINEVMQEITNFNLYSENFVYSTFISLIEGTNIVNYGSVGLGKSRATKELIVENETIGIEGIIPMPKVKLLVGKFTPKSFFNTIQEYGNCTLLFDEGDMILKNKKINQMIKTLLTNKVAYWNTDDGVEPAQFNGSIILNVNNYSFNNDIEDKVLVNQQTLTTREFKEKIKNSRDYEPNMDIWEQLRERVIYARNNHQKLTENEKDMIYNLIMNLEYIPSFRVKTRFFQVFRGMKNLFGSLQEDSVVKKAKRLAKNSINEDMVSKVLQNYEANEEIIRKELKKRIAQAKSCSKRTANREIRNMINDGMIKKCDGRGTKIAIRGGE